MHVRRDDTVVLTKDITGNPATEKGKVAKILRVLPEGKRVIVEGVNYRWRHVRPSQTNPRGGRTKKELPIHISNVMLYCEHCNAGTRAAKKMLSDGQKVRVCRECGERIGAS